MVESYFIDEMKARNGFDMTLKVVKLSDYTALLNDTLAVTKNLKLALTEAYTRQEELEKALSDLLSTVQHMRNPQTLGDVALMVLQFTGPMTRAEEVLGIAKTLYTAGVVCTCGKTVWCAVHGVQPNG
jgi:hypothetical protein